VDFVVASKQTIPPAIISVNSNILAMNSGPDELISLSASPALVQEQRGLDSVLENGVGRVDELESA
jgi:hypothetical protein